MDPNLQVSNDAARALEEFSEEFRTALALGPINPWASDLGLVRNTNALKTSFPIPVSAAGYHEFKGDMKYRQLYERSLSMTMKKWQDGVEEFADVLEAPDFIDWAGEPARMATEWMRQPNIMVADMLALNTLDGPVLDFYTDKDSGTAGTRKLFAADHPFNVFNVGLGDFDNRLSVTAAEIANGTAWDSITAHFRAIKGANGKPLGLTFSGGYCLVPYTRENLFKNALEFDTLIRNVASTGTINASASVVAAVTQNNRYKGTFGYTVSDELADQDHFYAFAAPKAGLYPWCIQLGTPEEFIHDKSSDTYKASLKVKYAVVGKANAAACLPHGIVRVTIT
jgi:hypothetical protein